MFKNRLLIKLLTVFLLFLFFGISISPIITVESRTFFFDKDIFNYTLEIHGIKGIETYNVILTKEQDKQLNLLIDNVNTELITAETMYDSINIFKNAALKIYELGLLPNSITAEQAQQFINYNNIYRSVDNFQDESYCENQEGMFNLENNDNFDCLIVGRTRSTVFSNDLKSVAFGWVDYWHESSPSYRPASGQVYTFGSNGFINWDGSFYGQLYTDSVWGPLYSRYYHVGLEGFYGFKWSRLVITLMIGTATHVALDTEPLTPKNSIELQNKNQMPLISQLDGSNFLDFLEQFPFLQRFLLLIC